MVKLNNRRLRNKRPKALIGDAIIGAGISAAATLASALIQSQEMKRSAQLNAKMQNQLAVSNANALKEQNDVANENLKRQLDFMKAENKKLIDRSNLAQMNTQMQGGELNERQRLDMSRIKVKRGGKIKLRNAKPSLRAVDNGYVEVEGNELVITSPNYPTPTTTDGGVVIPVGTTRDGNIINLAVGASHDDKHQSPVGRTGGIGMETEGNALVLSKHTHRGFNPVQAVNEGMEPEEAFEIQESLKDMDKQTPVGKKRRLRCGGRIKREYGGGMPVYLAASPYFNPNNYAKPEDYKSNMSSYSAPVITGLANIGGALISNYGNKRASSIQRLGNVQAANTLADAYDRLQTIDLSQLDRNSFRAPHAMAVVRDPNVNITPQLAAVDRSLQRRLSNIRRNSLSGAAALNRYNRAEADAFDQRSNIFAAGDKLSEAIRQQNAATLTEVANQNATRDAEASKDYSKNYLSLLEYNNDIANERIRGRAQTMADMYQRNSNILGQTRMANASGLANAITNTGNTIVDTLNTRDKLRFELMSALAGAINKETAQRVYDLARAYGISLT